ncbi:MAG: hypothetical protein GF401_07085 [Chitinivibrionales bacterium]|nr:hypothetical protein [Chitinivibrionales bacterium]
MMKQAASWVIHISAIVIVWTLSINAAPPGPNYHGIRSMGMGNTTVAVTTDRTAIFHNPAGLGLLRDKVQISSRPLIFAIDGEFFDYLELLGKYKDEMSDIETIAGNTQFMDDISSRDGYWAGVEYIPEITVATKNLGFGIYSVWPIGLRIETGHFIPKLGFRGRRDLVFTWAVGIPLKHESNHFGVSLEYLQRSDLDSRITTYSETFFYFEEASKSPFGVIGDLSNLQHGASFDIGFMHDLFPGFRLAYSVKDLFGVVGGRVFVPRLDLGCAYYVPPIENLAFLRSIIASFEITDLWGFEEKTEKYEQFGKKIHLGAEIDLQYLALRGGINQGYPTFGLGVMAGPVSLDYVYYTEESGYYAGQMPRSKHVVSLGLALNVAAQGGYEANDEEISELSSLSPDQSSFSTDD